MSKTYWFVKLVLSLRLNQLEERQSRVNSLTKLTKNIPIRKMHWLAQGLRKVKFQAEPGVIMETQNFKRNLLLIWHREGKNNLTLVVCFLLPLKREIKEI